MAMVRIGFVLTANPSVTTCDYLTRLRRAEVVAVLKQGTKPVAESSEERCPCYSARRFG